MSTHCFIGVTQENNQLDNPQVEYIYCHLDGGPQGVGETLQENYQDEQKIRGLIALGDLTCLGPTLENIRMEIQDDFTPCTTARRRDQHMPWEKCQPMTVGSVQDFWALLPASNVDYQYLYDQGSWQVNGAGLDPGPLQDALPSWSSSTLRVKLGDTLAAQVLEFTNGVQAGFSQDGLLVEIRSRDENLLGPYGPLPGWDGKHEIREHRMVCRGCSREYSTLVAHGTSGRMHFQPKYCPDCERRMGAASPAAPSRMIEK